MRYKLTIQGRLKTYNDYILACRGNKYKGAAFKNNEQAICYGYILEQLQRLKINKRVWIDYHWYEPTRTRDKDNLSSWGRKVIQDALVKAGTLKNDGWSEIEGFSDYFYVDCDNPRIEIIITEIGDG